MLEGVVSYLGSKPKRAMQIILCLSVVLILLLIVILSDELNVWNLFAPPYPDEETPLTLTADGVTWTMDNSHVLIVNGSYFGYNHLRFIWGEDGPIGKGYWGGYVANDSEQQQLDMNSSATVEAGIGGTSLDDAANWTWYDLVIKDVHGDGAFTPEDSITFRMRSTSIVPLVEDTVYTFAMIYLEDGTAPLGEYSCAVHDGKFYSWQSDTLNWNRAWWDH
jgi:hypothetical protein